MLIRLEHIPEWPSFVFKVERFPIPGKNLYFAEFATMLIVVAKDDPSTKYRVLCTKKHETIKRDETTFRLEMIQVLAHAMGSADSTMENIIMTEGYVKSWNSNPINFPIIKVEDDGTGSNQFEGMEPKG